jgi:glycosyltransferase involved in cell wall biosynthesis
MAGAADADPIRAVIDARAALDPRKTGIGHYADQIVRHLPAADPRSSYVAWHLDPKGVRRGAFGSVAPNLTEAVGRFPNRWFEPVSSRLGRPRIDPNVGAFDVLLATNFLPPATRSRCVVPVVHDLAFDVFPQTAPHVDARWRRRFGTWLDRAPRVIVPSAATAADLAELHGVDPGRVEVVHHGTEAGFRPVPPPVVADVRRRFGMGEGPYALFVGGIEPRKNLEALVRAFQKATAEDRSVTLVIAGGEVRWFRQAVDGLAGAIASLSPEARSRVIRVGHVGDQDKAALLSDASMLAYPSLYEGFGFPVLEAFAAGLPVLTSSASSLPEIAGDAAVLVDPNDEEAIAEGIRSILADASLRERLVAAGRLRLALFSWEACGARTAEVLHGARDVARGR